LLRSLQEIQPDFEEEAKAYAGLWSQGKKNQIKKNEMGWRIASDGEVKNAYKVWSET
jgi:hypothetical protein